MPSITPRSGRRGLGVLRCLVADLVPGGLVCDLEVEARVERKLAHQARSHEVLLAEIVVQAGSAVATEVARRELALVARHQVLAFGEPEVLLGHDHAGETRARPALAAGAVAVAQRLGIANLVLHPTAQASSLERLRHDGLSRVAVDDSANIRTRRRSGKLALERSLIRRV